MTDFHASEHSETITTTDRLVELFHEAGKPRSAWRIGTEYEKVVVDPDTGHAAPFSGRRGIETVLRALAERFAWYPHEDDGRVVALARDGASITLEPGGQLELSGAPFVTLHETHAELATHVRELTAVCDEIGLAVLGLGIQPISTLDQIEWVPKPRYRIMGPYMTRVGTRGQRMMKQTATVQANVDYLDERDAMRKLRIGMGLAPVVNAMFANSCISEGALNGYASMRGHIWEDTDRARSGLLPFAFRPDARFRDYVEWALDAPLYFLLRNGRYVTDVTGIPFRQYLAAGSGPYRATVDDWNLHLTTLFPEVRLKGFLELRSADSQAPERVVALPALVKGLFHDDDCLDAAMDLVKRWTFEDVAQVYHEVVRAGFRPRLRGIPILELANEVLEIAAVGLRRQAVLDTHGQDEQQYLEALREAVSRGLNPSMVLTERWNAGWSRDVRGLIAFTRFTD